MNIPLWEKEAPFFDIKIGQEAPSLTSFRLGSSARRGAVIVLPGGGYQMRAEHEGRPVAKLFNNAGFHAFVLNYRFAPYRHPAALLDIQRSIRLLRSRAEELCIIPDKIFVIGFSAGGHLCAASALMPGEPLPFTDEIDTTSCRPDAAILCYPVIDMASKWAHKGSAANLLGANASMEALTFHSMQNRVTADAPPFFIWHTADDNAVPVENSLLLANALSEKSIPYEMHIFPNGPHGLGLAQQTAGACLWPDLSIGFLNYLEEAKSQKSE